MNITRNGQSVDSFDYLDGFCRYDVRSKHRYHNGDVIAAYLQGIESPLRKETLDLSTPHLLSAGEGYKFKPCGKIGRGESVILVPEGWSLESSGEGLQITEMSWEDMPFNCIWIPENFVSEVILSGDDGRINFGANTNLSWTEVTSPPLSYPEIIEPLYNASRLSCFICSESDDDTVRKMAQGIEFRNKCSDSWSSTPSYGEVFVRAKSSDGNYIAHERIINIGDSLKVKTIEAGKERCKIRIDWPYGFISGPVDATVKDGDWTIERKSESGVDRNHIAFTFTPSDNIKNSFSLHVRAPFKDFALNDPDGNRIINGCTIPYSDVDKYSYYIVGVDVKLRIRKTVFNIKWVDDQLSIHSEERGSIQIPYEGSLTRILGSREDIKTMLERTSNDVLHASVPVRFDLPDGKSFSFSIKEAPYLIRQNGDAIYVIEKNVVKNKWSSIRYNHALKLLEIDDPSIEPVTIRSNEDGFFIIPEEVKEWGNTLVVGRNRGRICPALVNTGKVLTPKDRQENRDDSINRIHDELNLAFIGSPVWKRISGWFERCNSEDIPASSLLDLACLKDSPDYLIKFALVKFAETPEDERDILDDRLLEMAKDLAFQWYWLLPRIHKGLVAMIESFIPEDSYKSEVMTKLFVSRVYQKYPNDLMIHLSNLEAGNELFKETLVKDCLAPLVNEFYTWLVKLCEKSLRRPFNKTAIDANSEAIISCLVNNEKLIKIISRNQEETFVTINQDLDDYTKSFFSQFKITGNKPDNDKWLMQRVKCIAEQIRGNVDMFNQSDSIRRSVIFYYRSLTKQFLLELNNELAK